MTKYYECKGCKGKRNCIIEKIGTERYKVIKDYEAELTNGFVVGCPSERVIRELSKVEVMGYLI